MPTSQVVTVIGTAELFEIRDALDRCTGQLQLCGATPEFGTLLMFDGSRPGAGA